jgi:hypothetical protein
LFLESLRSGSAKKPANQLCNVRSIEEVEQLLDILPSSIKLTLLNLEELQRKWHVNIVIYHILSDEICPYYKPPFKICPLKESIHILLKGDQPDVSKEIKKFQIIFNLNFIPTKFICKLVKGCSFSTSDYKDFKRHQETCLESSTQKITAKEKSYGTNSSPLQMIVEAGYLPELALSFRKTIIQTYDIETFEQLEPTDLSANTIVHATHKLLSIAVGNSVGYKKCFVRADSSHEAAENMIKCFVDSLDEMIIIYEKHIPDYFFDAIDVMEEDLKSNLSRVKKAKISSMLNMLKSYTKMDCFGFNSGWSIIISN